MNLIKNYFVTRNIKKWLEADKPLNVSEEKIKKVLILLDLDSKQKGVDYEEVFRDLNVQLFFLGFKKQIFKNKVPSVPCFSVKDISLTGRIKKASAVSVLNESPDLLLYGFQKPVKPLLLVATQVNTGLRVGFHQHLAHYTDLLIRLPKPETGVIREELVKYLKALNKI